MTTRYFLTVDWCKQGKRGVFCDTAGDKMKCQNCNGKLIGFDDSSGAICDACGKFYEDKELFDLTEDIKEEKEDIR